MPAPVLAKIGGTRLEFLLIYLAGLDRDFKKLTGAERADAAVRMAAFLTR